MEMALTLAITFAALALTIFAGWKSGRPRKDTAKTQWISWPLVTVLAGTAVVFALVHVVNLMGFHTGANAAERYRF